MNEFSLTHSFTQQEKRALSKDISVSTFEKFIKQIKNLELEKVENDLLSNMQHKFLENMTIDLGDLRDLNEIKSPTSPKSIAISSKIVLHT